ncbi:MAG: phosphonate metabolism protein/1,5-bisphosphokinase (PRPP-forming) PhnN [Pseudomonadota bacterium]
MGRLIAVVGPSGAGKDTLLDAARDSLRDALFVQRVITRAASPGTEGFEPVSEEEFAARDAAGAFAFTWPAHGLCYGIPVEILPALEQGRMVIFNGSRGALPRIREVCPQVEVILITAPRDVLAARLAARGRETADEVERRLDRADLDAPPGARVVVNDGSVDEGVARFLAALTLSGEGG